MRRISCALPAVVWPHYRRSPRTALLLIYRIQSHTHPKRRKFCLKHAGQKSVKDKLPEQRKGPKRVAECRLKVPTHVWELEAASSSLATRTILGRRLWISHSGAKLWDTPVNNRGVPLFVFIIDCSGLCSEIELHHFCEREKKAGFTGESIAPLLTRMFLSAPLFQN